jgi:hypothetical protein
MSRPATAKLKVNAPLGTLPVLQYCAPDQLKIDETYQRTLETGSSQALIRRIAMYWDWGLCQPLFVARRSDGGLYVVDGQHRLAAAILRGDIWQLPCVVSSFDTAADEAASFVALNQQRRPLTKLDVFKAELAAGDREAVAIVATVEAAGLHIASSTNLATIKPGSVSNIGGLQRCIRAHGPGILQRALEALRTAYPNEVLRYAGTIFPGLVVLATVDSISPEEIGAFTGSQKQGKWYRRTLEAMAADNRLGRWSAAQRVFRDAWQKQRLAGGGGAASKGTPPPSATFLKPTDIAWCRQCDQRVSGEHAARCTSQFCSLKVKDAA